MQTIVLRIPDDLAAEIEAEARRLRSTNRQSLERGWQPDGQLLEYQGQVSI